MNRSAPVVAFAAVLVASATARAQLTGALTKGQAGLAAGTQAPEGVVIDPFAYDYYATSLVGPDGKTYTGLGSLHTLVAPGLSVSWVSPWKVAGASFGMAASVWAVLGSTNIPRLNSSSTSYGFSDTYLQPIALGWHSTYVDAIAGAAVYIPTGRYAQDANDNTGQGHWGLELSAGATAWFDRGHHLNLAALFFFDDYTARRQAVAGVRMRTGDTVMVQGGLGYQFHDGMVNVGVPYFVEKKITRDVIPPGTLPPGPVAQMIDDVEDWSVGVGGEVTVNVGAYDGFTLRYVRTVAGLNTTLGGTAFVFYNHLIPID